MSSKLGIGMLPNMGSLALDGIQKGKDRAFLAFFFEYLNQLEDSQSHCYQFFLERGLNLPPLLHCPSMDK